MPSPEKHRATPTAGHSRRLQTPPVAPRTDPAIQAQRLAAPNGAVWPLLLLILAANGAPLLLRQLCRNRWAAPVDLGLRLPDGRRLFGATKTWRGIGVALVAGMALAPLLGLPPLLGLAAGGLAMAGDLLSSFAKRRLGLSPGSRARLLDTLPEALLPALALMAPLNLTGMDVLLLVMLFTLVHSLASRLLYRLRLRRRPW